ncbi:MAG: sigma-70 family RNA polymerase sigma factor [Planctomycetota bacterium]
MSHLAPQEFAFLEERDPDLAWSQLLDSCLGTIERAVRRVVQDDEESRTVVAEVLDRIHTDWPSLIERYQAGRDEERGSFRPWLAVVVRRLAIDVLRSLHGRPTPPRAVQRMSPVQQRLFQLLYRERRRLEEAYDVLVAEDTFSGTYAELAVEVRGLEDGLPASARVAAATPRRPARAAGGAGEDDGAPPEPVDRGSQPPSELLARRAAHEGLAGILAELSQNERLLLRAYYIEGATARDVARLVGATSERSVYDRVQALVGRLRAALERAGLGPDDLQDLMDFDWNTNLERGAQ